MDDLQQEVRAAVESPPLLSPPKKKRKRVINRDPSDVELEIVELARDLYWTHYDFQLGDAEEEDVYEARQALFDKLEELSRSEEFEFAREHWLEKKRKQFS